MMQRELEFGNSPDSSEISLHKEFLLIVDTETTGLDSEIDHCIEVGAILFHVGTRSVIAQTSFLIPVKSNSAQNINKISPEITNLNNSWLVGLEYLKSLIDSSDAVVAHNAAFDRQWFGKENLPEIKKPWICSMDDIRWPVNLNLRPRPSVRDLALAYEVPVWSAHRALTDCIYISEVFRRCTNLEKLLKEALVPKKLVRARVSYDQRHLARNAGFRWNDPVPGAWTRRLNEKEIDELSFSVDFLDE